MGRLGDWDKVEKRNRPVKFTRSDELWEYAKMCVLIFLACTYLYFLFWGQKDMSKRVEMTINKKVIENVLEKFSEDQINLGSSSARKMIAEKIEEALLLKGLRHDIYWK